MTGHPPKEYGISERVKWFMDRDATCIADAENFRARWGGYPHKVSQKKRPKSKIEIPESAKPSKPVQHQEKTMSAKSEFFEGKSLWRFELGYWRCVSSDDCLKFLLKKDVPAAKLELIRRGFDWQWENPS